MKAFSVKNIASFFLPSLLFASTPAVYKIFHHTHGIESWSFTDK